MIAVLKIYETILFVIIIILTFVAKLTFIKEGA